MATATLELVNPYSKIGLKRRPTYNEIINLIDENETITGKLPDRTATFYKASPEGSFFDGTDHLEILKEQQNRILEREMRGILMRQNARANGRTFNVDRIQSSRSSGNSVSSTSRSSGNSVSSTSSSSGTATPEVQADTGGMVSAQIQTELEARARRETSRQQARFETHRDEVQRQGFVPTIQSFLSGITTPIRTRTRRSSESREHSRPTPIDLSREEEEEAEEEYFPEMMTAREEQQEQEQQQEEQPKKKTKLMKDISYSTNISRWKEEELEFQLFIRGTDPRDPEVSLEGLRKKGRGKGLTNWQHLNNLAQEMINDGRWERRVEQELLKKRISEYKQRQKPRGSRD